MYFQENFVTARKRQLYLREQQGILSAIWGLLQETLREGDFKEGDLIPSLYYGGVEVPSTSYTKGSKTMTLFIGVEGKERKPFAVVRWHEQEFSIDVHSCGREILLGLSRALPSICTEIGKKLPGFERRLSLFTHAYFNKWFGEEADE